MPSNDDFIEWAKKKHPELVQGAFPGTSQVPAAAPVPEKRTPSLALDIAAQAGGEALAGPAGGAAGMAASRAIQRAAVPPRNPNLYGATTMVPPPLGPPLSAAQVLNPKELTPKKIGTDLAVGAGSQLLMEGANKALKPVGEAAGRLWNKATPKIAEMMTDTNTGATSRLLRTGKGMLDKTKGTFYSVGKRLEKFPEALRTLKDNANKFVDPIYKKFGLGGFESVARRSSGDLGGDFELLMKYPGKAIDKVKGILSKGEGAAPDVLGLLKKVPPPKGFASWAEVPKDILPAVAKSLGIDIPVVKTPEELIAGLPDLSPEEDIRQAVKLKREIYKAVDHVYQTVKPMAGKIVDSGEAGLLKMGGDLREVIGKMEGAGPLKEADAAWHKMRDLYDQLQPHAREPGKIESFFQKIMDERGSPEIKRDLMPKLQALEQRTGVHFMGPIRDELSSQSLKKVLPTRGYMGKFAMARIPAMAVGAGAAGALGYKHPTTLAATIPTLAMVLGMQSPRMMAEMMLRAPQLVGALSKLGTRAASAGVASNAADVLGGGDQ